MSVVPRPRRNSSSALYSATNLSIIASSTPSARIWRAISSCLSAMAVSFPLAVFVSVFCRSLQMNMGLCVAIVRIFQTFATSDMSQMQRRDVPLWLSLRNLLDRSVAPSNYLVDTQ